MRAVDLTERWGHCGASKCFFLRSPLMAKSHKVSNHGWCSVVCGWGKGQFVGVVTMIQGILLEMSVKKRRR